jgi:hypothetical protein
MDRKSSPKKCADQEKVELSDKAINEVIENEYEKAILESTGVLTVTSEQYKEYFDICYQFLAVENGHRYNIRLIPHEGNTDPQKNGIRIGLSFISLQRGKNGLEKDTTKYLLSEDDPVTGLAVLYSFGYSFLDFWRQNASVKTFGFLNEAHPGKLIFCQKVVPFDPDKLKHDEYVVAVPIKKRS